MSQFVLIFGWTWICVGLISGTLIGIWFHHAQWLGGYDSWQRRMVRLGHISFLGTGLLTLAMFFSFRIMNVEPIPAVSAAGLVLGSITMPAVCFLSACRKPLRHLFVIPVTSLLAGALTTLVELARLSQ